MSLQLVKALYHVDRFRELIDWLAPRADMVGRDPSLLAYLGRSALMLGDLALAESALRRAAAAGAGEAVSLLAEALVRRSRNHEALVLAQDRLETAPTDFLAQRIVFGELLGADRHEELWELIARLRSRGVWQAYLPSAAALAARTDRQVAEVAELVAPATWLDATTLPDCETLNEGLLAELAELDPAPVLPAAKSTNGAGLRFDRLELVGTPFFRSLDDSIRKGIAGYVADRAGRTEDPFLSRRPEDIRVRMWGLSVRGHGHEGWHIHPDGWLSGVYYVRVPPRPAGHSRRGAIEFAPFPLVPFDHCRAWPSRTIRPHAGQLLLFPSFYGHRTWPTRAREGRICISFDVIGSPAPLEHRSQTPPLSNDEPRDDLVPVRNGELIATVVRDGILLMRPSDGSLHRLNGSGAAIWRRIDGKRSIRDLIRTVASAYASDPAQIADEVRAIARDLARRGLTEFQALPDRSTWAATPDSPEPRH